VEGVEGLWVGKYPHTFPFFHQHRMLSCIRNRSVHLSFAHSSIYFLGLDEFSIKMFTQSSGTLAPESSSEPLLFTGNLHMRMRDCYPKIQFLVEVP